MFGSLFLTHILNLSTYFTGYVIYYLAAKVGYKIMSIRFRVSRGIQ